MAKAVILDLLENTIGKYVLNLDASALNVAVWKGNIELHSLKLDVDAINRDLAEHAKQAPNLALPFRLESGGFDSLSVEVPWTKLSSRSVIFRAKSLHIKLELHNFLSEKIVNDIDSEKKISPRDHAISDAEKSRIRSKALRELTVSDGLDESSAKDDGFGAKLLRRILENLQVEVSDVQIELHGANCRTGAILESLQLTSTDKNGKACFVDRTKNEHFLYKALAIRGFGIYCDGDESNLQGKSLSSNQLHDFLLSPLSFSVSLRQCDLDKCIEFPKYKLNSSLSNIGVIFSRDQAIHIQQLVEDIKEMRPHANILFPEYRPLSPISAKTAKDWWKYAYRCVGRLNRRRSWAEFFLAFKKRQKYIKLYKRSNFSKDCKWLSPLSGEEMNDLKLIERDTSISVDGIMSWRNLAESQIKMEREKRDARILEEKKSRRKSSFFGKRTSGDIDNNEAPVVLSIEEMKELEALSLDNIEESKMTEDSKVAEIDFILSSFSIDFVDIGGNTLANFSMGRIDVDFATNADGSLSFGLGLQSLALSDLVSRGTMFPTIVKTLQSSTNALDFRLDMTKTGDQHLYLNLVALELIASPTFCKKMITFFLVKDENESEFPNKYEVEEIHSVENSFPSGDALSEAIADVWNSKNKNNQSWKIELSVHAPIIIIPQDCTKLDANILILNMGHFRLLYGCEPAQSVTSWFNANGANLDVDYSKLEINSIAVYSGTVKDKISKSSTIGESTRALLKPFSLVLDAGIENSPERELTRICVNSVIQVVSISVSFQQITQISSVMMTWVKFGEELSELIKIKSAGNIKRTSQVSSERISNEENCENSLVLEESTEQKKKLTSVYDCFHGYVKLKRLSVELVDDFDRVEAHLVSVSFSQTNSTNGSISSRIRMGWFGVLGSLHRVLIRKQRFVIHSEVPEEMNILELSSSEGIERNTEKINSMEDSAGLHIADILIKNIPGSCEGQDDIDMKEIEGNFSSVIIKWNPKVIDELLKFSADFIRRINSFSKSFSREQSHESSQLSNTGRKSEQLQILKQAKTLVKARLESFRIEMNSVLDDLPIGIITLAQTQVTFESHEKIEQQNYVNVVAEVGDLRIETRPSEKVCGSYYVILGLAPNQTKSLLTVSYYKGEAVENAEIDEFDKKKCDACALVDISPMRFVYIQAQVLTLIDYLTSGILGAVTSSVASSAAAAAVEVANAVEGEQLYLIKTTSLYALIPQAAYRDEYFAVAINDVQVSYRMFPSNGGGKCEILLDNLMISSSQGIDLVEDRIRANVKVSLPGDSAVTAHDKAKSIEIDITSIALILLDCHYHQLMITLEDNIGESDSFLRNTTVKNLQPRSLSNDEKIEISHSGRDVVNDESRIYVQVVVGLVSLKLFDKDVDHPFMQLTTEEANFTMKLLSDQQKSQMNLKLNSVVVDDLRIETIGRPFRRLICNDSTTLDKKGAVMLDIATFNHGSRSIKIDLDSVQVVYLSDLIHQLLKLLERPSKSNSSDSVSIDDSKEVIESSKTLPPFCNNSEGPSINGLPSFIDGNIMVSTDRLPSFSNGSMEQSIEIIPSFIAEQKGGQVKHEKFCLKTKCRFLFVDIGIFDDLSDYRISSHSNILDQITEVVAIQGDINVSLSSEFEEFKEEPISSSTEIECDNFQVYKAQDDDLKQPVQIVEPVDFSFFMDKSNLKFASLTPLQIFFSMQDLALFHAILSSISARSNVAKGADEEIIEGLSKIEEERIQKLANLLQNDESQSFSESSISTERQSGFTMRSIESSENNQCQFHSFTANVTFIAVSVLIINDLEGLDNALFKLNVANLLGSARMDIPQDGSGNRDFSKAKGESQVHTSFEAQYFDAASNRFEPLLLDQWEWTLNCKRQSSKILKGVKFMSTLIDIEARSCDLKFSEQFLVSLGGASKMWSSYSKKKDFEKRALILSTPYGIENKCGIPIYYQTKGKGKEKYCDIDQIEYFCFENLPNRGVGGQRQYGQDITEANSVTIHLQGMEFAKEGNSFIIEDINGEINRQRAHHLKGGHTLFTEVVRTPKALILRIQSRIQIQNKTSIPFEIITQSAIGLRKAGICGKRFRRRLKSVTSSIMFCQPKSTSTKNVAWPSLGVPIDTLLSLNDSSSRTTGITLLIKPFINSKEDDSIEEVFNGDSIEGRWGVVALPPPYALKQLADKIDEGVTKYDVLCGDSNNRDDEPFVVQVRVDVKLIDNEPFVKIFLHPRLTLENLLPVGIFFRTPMSYTFDHFGLPGENGRNETIHHLMPNHVVNVFTPGSTIAFSLKLADAPDDGGLTTWIGGSGEWLSIPLSNAGKEKSNVAASCLLPFIDAPGGHAIEIIEEETVVSDTFQQVYKLFVRSKNIAIDHTGEFLFIQSTSNGYAHRKSGSVPKNSYDPWSSFSSRTSTKRLTLLPDNSSPMFMRKQSGGISRQSPVFEVEDIVVGGGGLESSAIAWANTRDPSGYFAYRLLGRNELHIIPEYILFNGCDHKLFIRQSGHNILLNPGSMAPIRRQENKSIIIMIEIPHFEVITAPVTVDSLGLELCGLRSTKTRSKENLIGSISVQTVIGGEDSRWVIKVGDLKMSGDVIAFENEDSFISKDFVRCRISLSDAQITMCQSFDNVNKSNFTDIVSMRFKNNLFDFQRIYKLEPPSTDIIGRTQIALYVDEISVVDCDVDSKFPVICDTSFENSALQLMVRLRNESNACMIKIDMFDLSIGYKDGKRDKLVIGTSEEFVWKLIDLSGRIAEAVSEMTSNHDLGRVGTDFTTQMIEECSTDEDSCDAYNHDELDVVEENKYTPPQSDKLFDIKIARVSPITLRLSFKRTPVSSRYKISEDASGARLMNYFTKTLKFTIDKADLYFSGYIERGIKGPPDHLRELIAAEYTKRLKSQVLALLQATTLQDWRNLTGRKDGKDDYVAGDVFRTAGNLSGKSANFVLKKATMGISDGITSVSGAIGSGVMKATSAIGADEVGRSVNSVVTGLGDGVGSTVAGVGRGAGQVIKGTGQGIGQVVGGLGGGVVKVTKGIRKSITTRDGSAAIQGFENGAVAIGKGFKDGISSVASGVGDGISASGTGIFNGIKSIGKGVRNSVGGKKETESK